MDIERTAIPSTVSSSSASSSISSSSGSYSPSTSSSTASSSSVPSVPSVPSTPPSSALTSLRSSGATRGSNGNLIYDTPAPQQSQDGPYDFAPPIPSAQAYGAASAPMISGDEYGVVQFP